jgi:hypothetical protein
MAADSGVLLEIILAPSIFDIRYCLGQQVNLRFGARGGAGIRSV